jgi:error-prone DNA polymerase
LLSTLRPGRRVTIGGLVLVRQRPGEGNAIFMTLEDETAIANTILWPRTFEAYRPVVMGARLISVTGVLQNEKGVIHIVADRFEDLTPLLRRLDENVSDVQPRSRADMVRADNPDRFRHPRSGDSFVRMAKERPALEELTAQQTADVMPKGRNFH